MKSLIAIALITVFSLATHAQATNLDGLTFCRDVETGGMFGQPKGVSQHCISFEDGIASDNANTFFGNPPEQFAYSVKIGMVFNLEVPEVTAYRISGRDLVYNKTELMLRQE